GGSTSAATVAATNIAQQDLIGGVAPSTITVSYSAGSAGGPNSSCTGIANFAVNPVVTVTVKRTNLPVFFARVFSLFNSTYSGSSVSATATAEAFNPSGSSPMIPVNPRCVKPWMVPNENPRGSCTGTGCPSFVDTSTGSITNPGTLAGNNGVIGETFDLSADCLNTHRRKCHLINQTPQAQSSLPPPPNPSLQYVPAQTLSASVAIAANAKNINGCSQTPEDTNYWNAVAGCDQTTVYACGNALANTVDLTSDNPGPPGNDSVNATQCLINSGGSGPDNGQDVLAPDATPYTYPFQIQAGTKSALTKAGITSGSQITSSPSIVTLPIYDQNTPLIALSTTPVTVVGFLQVFINSATTNGTTATINVTVMNVVGCGNGSSPGPPVALGTSPVPIRLITPP
ncbi:MAG: hypothetical protein WBQ81_11575, partial [Candidatus Sulfotelmatobacter sp.]